MNLVKFTGRFTFASNSAKLIYNSACSCWTLCISSAYWITVSKSNAVFTHERWKCCLQYQSLLVISIWVRASLFGRFNWNVNLWPTLLIIRLTKMTTQDSDTQDYVSALRSFIHTSTVWADVTPHDPTSNLLCELRGCAKKKKNNKNKKY